MDRPAFLFTAITTLALAAGTASAEPGASSWFTTDQGEVRLVAAQPFVGDGDTVALGLEFRLKPQWKIYWRSPGDAGYPPRLDWAGSQNLVAADIDWPAPRRFSVLGFETAGYEGTVVLPITARLATAGAAVQLHAALDYLTCAEICVPYQTVLSLDLPAMKPADGGTGFAALIARYAALVPGDGHAAGLALAGATVRPGDPARLELEVRSDRPLDRPDAFIEGGDGVAFGAPELRPGKAPDQTELRLPVFGKGDVVAALAGRSIAVTLVDDGRAMTGTIAPVGGAAALDLAALWPMLAVALLGGLILNVMPCVLPVLSLKLVGAVQHRERPLRAVRAGFLATAAGIVASFAGLAAAMIALTGAGKTVGWGMQFQEPLFLGLMAALLLLFAANLWGWFEVPLPRRVADLAGRTALGNFASGAFATLLATPCSAPFLGTALGFALASGPVEIVAIFLALGVGFAAPYLVVAAVPALVRLLPRPGRWMLLLRRLLGVALAGTAVWLVAILLAGQAPERGAYAGGPWRKFDAAALGPLVHDGAVVFVDVTADWCLTCKVNERLVLDSDAVRARLGAAGVVAMRADWTRPDAAITAYLRRFGRYGIPFNAVYGPGAPAGVALPEILTADAVLAALRRAAAGGDGRG